MPRQFKKNFLLFKGENLCIISFINILTLKKVANILSFKKSSEYINKLLINKKMFDYFFVLNTQ